MQVNSEILDRLPPQDLDAERRLLYALFVQPARIDDVADLLGPDDFYSEANRIIYKALVALHLRHRNVDAGMLARHLRSEGNLETIGGMVYLADILSVAHASVDTAAHHAREVHSCARRREVIHTATEMLRSGWDMQASVDDVLEGAEASLGRLRTSAACESVVDAPTAAMQFVDHVDAVQARRDQGGLMTGLWKFDEVFGGLFPGEYAIIAADSSAGKTSLGCQIAEHNAAKGRLVYFASLEMETIELTQRMVCAIAEVNSRAIRTGKLHADDVKKLADGASEFSRRAIRIDPRTDLKVSDIRRAARRLLKDGLAMVMVDYIGLIEPDDYKVSREQQVARVSRGLKNLAKELKVPVIALCQLNREKASNERPSLRNLRESGAIGNDAHMVLFLHKPPDGIVDTEYKNEPQMDGSVKRKKTVVERDWPAELILAKNRNGETGTIRLDWEAQYTRFSCWDKAENMANYEDGFAQFNGEEF